MKILITLLISLSLMAPAGAAFAAKTNCGKYNLPWQCTGSKSVEANSEEGYSESQRDYKSRKRRSEKSKQSAGYRNGKYHIKGEKHQHHDWQFID